MNETKPFYIFFLLGVLMFNFFFHVWSAGSFNTLSFEITQKNEKKAELLEQKRLLETELASLKSPQRIEMLSKILEFNPPTASQIELLK
jgi:hypothetical protein